MSDTTDKLTVPPVFTEDMRRYYSEVESFQRNAARSANRKLRFSLTGNAVQFLLICGLTAAIVEIVPWIRIQPVFVPGGEGGTYGAAATPDGLPPSLNETQQKAAAWQWIRLFEGYSQVESEYAWNVVSAMSAKPVREQYQADHDPKNKQAPINVFGDRVVVHAEFVSMSPACDSCTNRYNVRFVRTVKQAGDPRPQRSTWVATIQWTTDMAQKIDYRQRITFNWPGIVITDYPGAQREDVAQ